jgi:single-stranded-DNA-specific exonuclease
MQVSAADLELEAVRSLDRLQPFGVENTQPMFMLSGCTVKAIYPLSGGKHTKLDIICDGTGLQALIFSRAPESMFFSVGDKIDIAAVPSVNSFNGRESVNVRVVDMKPAGMDTDRYFAARDSYEKLRHGAELPQAYLRKMTPSRQELVYIYKLIAQLHETALDELFMRLNSRAFNYCKLRLMADIFCEAGLMSFKASEQKVTVLPPKGKADLMSTPTMRMLTEALESK